MDTVWNIQPAKPLARLAKLQIKPTIEDGMRTAKKSRNKLSPTTDKFRPEDLEAMRQAFICACHDNPDLSATEAQRYDLADAMVSVYQKHFTQLELVAATVRKIKELKP